MRVIDLKNMQRPPGVEESLHVPSHLSEIVASDVEVQSFEVEDHPAIRRILLGMAE